MRGIFLIRSRLSIFRASAANSLRSSNVLSNKCIVQPHLELPIACVLPLSLCSNFSTSKKVDSEKLGFIQSSNEKDDESEEEIDLDLDCIVVSDDVVSDDVKMIVKLLRDSGSDRKEFRNKLEKCCVKPSNRLVVEILSRVRNDWETAFTFFVWAGNQQGYVRSVREYHSMISILGKMRKFDTAWTLIYEMRTFSPSLVNSQTLLIMIRKYCAVHDVGKAINTFHAYKRFKLGMGIDDFQSFLSALCRYKNVSDAEHLIFCNKDTYPFDAKSFNIVLNGWCNVICSPREAERVWLEMGNVGVKHDVVSYSCMISCYSKGGSLNKVLRLFDRMKKECIEPDRKVYNAVVHALAKAKFVSEARNLMKTMEEEKGMKPDVVTYNSLIKPLCKAGKTEEAKQVFDDMLEKGLSPTIPTYHAFMRILRTGEEIFEILVKMRRMGCEPTVDTYIMLIRKLCRWRDFDNVLLLWDEMKEKGIGPDLSSYIVMIHGLFLNGKVEEAYGYYKEMKEKGMRPDESVEDMIQSWFSGKQYAEQRMIDSKGNVSGVVDKGGIVKKSEREENFLLQPEVRRVVRKHGYSFWIE